MVGDYKEVQTLCGERSGLADQHLGLEDHRGADLATKQVVHDTELNRMAARHAEGLATKGLASSVELARRRAELEDLCGRHEADRHVARLARDAVTAHLEEARAIHDEILGDLFCFRCATPWGMSGH